MNPYVIRLDGWSVCPIGALILRIACNVSYILCTIVTHSEYQIAYWARDMGHPVHTYVVRTYLCVLSKAILNLNSRNLLGCYLCFVVYKFMMLLKVFDLNHESCK